MANSDHPSRATIGLGLGGLGAVVAALVALNQAGISVVPLAREAGPLLGFLCVGSVALNVWFAGRERDARLRCDAEILAERATLAKALEEIRVAREAMIAELRAERAVIDARSREEDMWLREALAKATAEALRAREFHAVELASVVRDVGDTARALMDAARRKSNPALPKVTT